MGESARRSAWWGFFGALCAWALYAAPCHLVATGMPDRIGLGWLAVQAQRFLEMPGRGLLQLLRPSVEAAAQPHWLWAVCVLAVLAAIGAAAGLVLSRSVKPREPAGAAPSGAAALALSVAGVFIGGYALGLAGAWLGRRARLGGAGGRMARAAEIIGFLAAAAWTLLLTLPPPQGKYWLLGP